MLILLVFAGLAFSIGIGPIYTSLKCGDTILSPGLYNLNGNLDIGANATCIGIDSENVTLDCQGHYINDSDFSEENHGVDVISGSANVTIKNCIFYNFNNGIRVNGISESQITDNQFSIPDDTTYINHPAAIYMYQSYGVTIARNKVIGDPLKTNYSRGFEIDSSSTNKIRDNSINYVGGAGIYFESSDLDNSDNNLSGNNVSFANDGFYFDGYGDMNVLEHNIANNTQEYGFYLGGYDGTSLSYNLANNCSYYGFYSYGWTNTYTANNATANGGGFYVEGANVNLFSNRAEGNMAEGFHLLGAIKLIPFGISEVDGGRGGQLYAQDNTANYNLEGFMIRSGVSLINNTAQENRMADFFAGSNPLAFLGGLGVSVDSEPLFSIDAIRVLYDCQNDTVQNLNGSGGRPIFFSDTPHTTVPPGTYSEVFLCDANYSALSNVIAIGSDSLNNNGIFLEGSGYSTITNSMSHDNIAGFWLSDTDFTNITGGRAYNNTIAGYFLFNAHHNGLQRLSSYNNNGSLLFLGDFFGGRDGGLMGGWLAAMPFGFGVLEMQYQSRGISEVGLTTVDAAIPIIPELDGHNDFVGINLYNNAYGAVLFGTSNDTLTNVNVYDNHIFGVLDASLNDKGASLSNCNIYRNGRELPSTIYSTLLFYAEPSYLPAMGPLPQLQPGLLYTEYAQGSYIASDLFGGIFNPGFGVQAIDPLPVQPFSGLSWNLTRTTFGAGPSAITVSVQDNLTTFSYLLSDTNLPATTILNPAYRPFVCATYHNETDAWFLNAQGQEVWCDTSEGGDLSICDGFQCFSRNETTGECNVSDIFGPSLSYDLNNNTIIDVCDQYSASIAFNFTKPENKTSVSDKYIFVGAAGTEGGRDGGQYCDELGSCTRVRAYDDQEPLYCHWYLDQLCYDCIDNNQNLICDETESPPETPQIDRFQVFYPTDYDGVKLYMLNITSLESPGWDLNPDNPINLTLNASWILVENQTASGNSIIVENLTPNGHLAFSIFDLNSEYLGIYGLFGTHSLGCTGDCCGGQCQGVIYHIMVDTSSCNGNIITVTDATGKPLSGVAVGIQGGPSFGYTDENGQVYFGTSKENQCGNTVVITADSEIKEERLAPCSDQCAQLPPSCGDTACKENERLNDACQCVPRGCTSDNDCTSDYQCENGQCGPKPSCTSDADCTGNQVCDAQTHRCQEKPAPPTCVNERDCCTDNSPCADSESCQGGSCKPVSGTCGYASGHQWVSYNADEAKTHCGENVCPACGAPPSGKVTGGNCVVGSDCEARSDPGYLVIKDKGGHTVFANYWNGGSVSVPSSIATMYTLTLYSGKGGPILSEATVNVLPKTTAPGAALPTAIISGPVLLFLVILLIILIALFIYWRMKSGKKK